MNIAIFIIFSWCKAFHDDENKRRHPKESQITCSTVGFLAALTPSLTLSKFLPLVYNSRLKSLIYKCFCLGLYFNNFFQNICLKILSFSYLWCIFLAMKCSEMSVNVLRRVKKGRKWVDVFWSGCFHTSQGHHSCTQEPWAVIFALLRTQPHHSNLCGVSRSLCTVSYVFMQSCISLRCVIFTQAHMPVHINAISPCLFLYLLAVDFQPDI